MNLSEIENYLGDQLLKVKYKKIKIWLLLRIKVKLALVYTETNKNFEIRTKNRVKLLKNLFYGFTSLFNLSKYSYIFFSNTNKRYLINNKYFDSYFDSIADRLGQRNSLFIEFAEKNHVPRSKIYSTNIISDLPFKVISLLLEKLIRIGSIQNTQIIKKIISENKLNINLNKEIREQISQYLLYRALFKIIKPKTIFVICYYSKLPMVFAAREIGIPVYEVQHGVINENNEYYNTIFKDNEIYFPNHLLAYGEDLIEKTPSNFIFKKDKIIPVGNYYLNYIKEGFTNSYLNSLKEKYQKIVCVTSQGLYYDVLMDYIKNLAIKHERYLFIIRPKYDEPIIHNQLSNIILLEQFDIYQILKYSDINITIYSMVAIEADFMGINNMLLNINNLSKTYLPNDINALIVNPDSYNDYHIPEKLDIIPQHNKYIKTNYGKNIKLFCNNIAQINVKD